MPGKHHSRATRLSAAFLARQAGTDAAAAAFGIAPNTIASWVAAGDVPDDEWTAIRDVLRARAAELSAKGDTRGLVATLTGAGIADRNVRYSTLIARREARRESEKEPPVERAAWLVTLEALDEQRGVLVAAELRAAVMGAPDGSEPTQSSDEDDAAFLAWIESVAALTDDEVRDRLLALEPEWADHYGWQSPLAALRDAIDAIDGPRGDGMPEEPPLTVTLVGDGTPEGTRSRLATDVTPGPEPKPEPQIGRDGVWVESPIDAPDAWEAWRRYDL